MNKYYDALLVRIEQARKASLDQFEKLKLEQGSIFV